ncbi:MAG: YebG family protein [Sedimenticola sp.]|uniref:Uncharacterized protein n=1 Tax=Sedimenticola thiotaurini TaxID=1543721 RepID=A0A558D3P9_9GAMM|nr:YebG family protein [Sedimenticola sp.]TVT55645.1 MAG: hypothetical protein FHK82_08075 [Sedimenticola thiotaurini]MCW8882347.1 YebG family protein [Sedimenticola sp.]MCW8919931.1 YebG family protein [Sedimenticola sp.]MCW8946975.1 YebG family protein [Sedimenticola sp.]
MAVISMWKCDRDNSMFDNKKEADAHDKLLELGEQFTLLLEKVIPQIDEKAAEEFGLVLAHNKEFVIQACKGRPEALTEILIDNDNVTKLKAS